MNKSIKNRGVLLKMLLVTTILLLVVTLIAFVGCEKSNYDNNSYTIEFNKKETKFTLPKDASLSVKKQTQYYVFEQDEAKTKKSIGDLIQYTFINEDNSKRTFRIEKAGQITRAGYFEKQGKFEIKLEDNENLYKRVEYDTKNLPRGLSGIEDIILTNIGNNYFKVLDIGEKFCLNLYRNNMIIDNVSGNLQIEPKFEIEILKGDSVIFDRKSENKFDVIGIKQGVTQVKIKYQAIEVFSNGNLFCYNAVDESREVIANFAVGENYTEDVEIKIENRAFDSEFDTIYFLEESGKIQAQIKGVSSVLCQGKSVPKINEDIFNLPINIGANVFEIVKGDKRQFMTIYGAKISINIQNQNGAITTDNKIQVGDRIKIKVNGIFNVLPKMSGIYNPTQQYLNSSTPSKGCKLQIVLANGEKIDAKYESQYFYKANSEIEFDMKSDYLIGDKFVFNLQFYAEWWGDELGTHRNIADNGMQINLDAKLYNCYMGYFEQIVIG